MSKQTEEYVLIAVVALIAITWLRSAQAAQPTNVTGGSVSSFDPASLLDSDLASGVLGDLGGF